MAHSFTIAILALLCSGAYHAEAADISPSFPVYATPAPSMTRQYLSLTFGSEQTAALALVAEALNAGYSSSHLNFTQAMLARRAKVIYSAEARGFELIIYAPPAELAAVLARSLSHLATAKDELKTYGKLHQTVVARRGWSLTDDRGRLHKIMEHVLSGKPLPFVPAQAQPTLPAATAALAKLSSTQPVVVVSTGPLPSAQVKKLVHARFPPRAAKQASKAQPSASTKLQPPPWESAFVYPVKGRKAHFIIAKKTLADTPADQDLLSLLLHPLTSGPGSFLSQSLRRDKKLIYGLGGYLRAELGAWFIESQGAIEDLDEILTGIGKGLATYHPTDQELMSAARFMHTQQASEFEFPPNRMESIRRSFLGGQKIDLGYGQKQVAKVPSTKVVQTFIAERLQKAPRMLFVAGNPLIVRGVLQKHGFKKDRIFIVDGSD